MTKVLGVIEPISDQKGRWSPEPYETELRARLGRQLLVEERADGQASRPPCSQQRHQALQRLASINNILDQQDMFAFQPGLGIVKQPYRTARDLPIPIRAGNQKINLDWSLDLPNQVTQ